MNTFSVIMLCVSIVLFVTLILLFIRYKRELKSKIDPNSEYNKNIQKLKSDFEIEKKSVEDTLNNLKSRLSTEQLEKVEELKKLYSDKQVELNNALNDETTRVAEQIDIIRNNLHYYEELQKEVVENVK